MNDVKKTFEEKKHRLALTLLFSGFVFAILLLVVLIAGGVMSLMIHFGLSDRITENSLSIYSLVWIMILVSTILGGALSYLIGRFLMTPLNIIINAMDALAAGKFETRIRFRTVFSRHPTVVELSESFNTLAEELEGTELLRSDFINNFSHEFKTPIVSIAGFASLLKKGGITPEQQTEYLDIIENESLRLSNMATNVLNMNRYENQTILTDIVELNLSEQLRNCVLLLENKWSGKNISIDIDLDEYSIQGNDDMLQQVWLNLLDNAIKFCPVNGQIKIGITDLGSALSVIISNNGNTIPPDSLKRIFNKFYQADESHASEGSGIGLSIVKCVVELHHGTVSAESRDGITTFSVILPKQQ